MRIIQGRAKMTRSELVKELKERYLEGKKRGISTMEVHLFGIEFAEDLQDYSTPELKKIADEATETPSYGSELYKMRRIAPYVELKSRP